MKIYAKEKRYDTKTGKCNGEELVVNHFRCDITGERIEDEAPTIQINYNSIDPCFGSFGKEEEFGEKYKVLMFDFLIQPYQFKNWDVYSALRSYMAQKCRSMTLDEALRNLRIEAATKLLEEKIIEPWQLLTEDEEFVEDEEDE